MNREFLKGLGLEDDAIDKVMAEHGKTVNATKGELDSIKTERDDLKTQLTDRDTQLADLKKLDPEALQAEITRLEGVNETTTNELSQKLADQQKEFAIESALKDAKARDPKLARSALDLETIVVKDGKVSGLDEQLTSLKESHDYLFEAEEETPPPNTPNIVVGGNPNGGTSGRNPFSKEHWNLTEQGKLFREDPDMYNNLKAQSGK